MKKLKIRSSFKTILQYGLWLFLFFVSALVLKIFVLEIYKIPSKSMEPSLLHGDYMMVQKITYGARLLKLKRFFKEGIIEYLRTKGLRKVEKGDVIVFNWPNYGSLYDSVPNLFGGCIVKRCYGCPGDTVIIDKERKMEEEIETHVDLFPFDTTLHWTISNYGPLFVPGKDLTIKLTTQNARHYKDVLMYEGFETDIRNDSVFLNNNYSTNFTFAHNYYFMKGDNFYGSQDSRYWGFVPEENIIGKAAFVLLSNNEDGFQWERVFKGIR